MKTTASAKASTKPRRRTAKEKRAAFERFAAEFGPKPGEKTRKKSGTGGAVEFLLTLRRGKT